MDKTTLEMLSSSSSNLKWWNPSSSVSSPLEFFTSLINQLLYIWDPSLRISSQNLKFQFLPSENTPIFKFKQNSQSPPWKHTGTYTCAHCNYLSYLHFRFFWILDLFFRLLLPICLDSCLCLYRTFFFRKCWISMDHDLCITLFFSQWYSLIFYIFGESPETL